jgi:hypothetical protein
MPGSPAHSVIIPAFVGKEVHLYTIDIALAPDRRSYTFRWTRHVHNAQEPSRARPPRFAAGGSGALHLNRDRRWVRALLRVVRAHERGQVSAHAVADELARVNYEVHNADAMVGPRCVVAWRHRKGGRYGGGGAHQFYNGTTREPDSGSLPQLSQGRDLQALIGVVLSHFGPSMLDALRTGEQPKEVDRDKVNAELAKLPSTPDEDLR